MLNRRWNPPKKKYKSGEKLVLYKKVWVVFVYNSIRIVPVKTSVR